MSPPSSHCLEIQIRPFEVHLHLYHFHARPWIQPQIHFCFYYKPIQYVMETGIVAPLNLLYSWYRMPIFQAQYQSQEVP